MMKSQPSPKGEDTDVRAMQVKLSTTATCGCTCACCAGGHAGHAGQDGPMSPLTERLLHQEPERIAAEALERRLRVIVEVLLPQVKALATALAKANEGAAVGPGELQILSTLQCWILQLQVEQEALRLTLKRPPGKPRGR